LDQRYCGRAKTQCRGWISPDSFPGIEAIGSIEEIFEQWILVVAFEYMEGELIADVLDVSLLRKTNSGGRVASNFLGMSPHVLLLASF